MKKLKKRTVHFTVLLNYWLLIMAFGMIIDSLYAQPPGYIGKRTPISLQINSFPAIRFSKLEEGKLPFNIHWGLKMEHVLSRRFSIGGSVSHIRVKTNYEFEDGLRLVTGDARINGIALGLNTRMYNFKRIGTIAPIGPYQQIEVMYLHYRMNDIDQQFYKDARTDLGSYRDLGISFGMGNQRIFNEHFTYSYSFKVGTVLGSFRNSQKTEAEIYLYNTAIDRLQGYFFLNINAGIGVILF